MVISNYIERFKTKNHEGKLVRIILLMTVIGSISGFENSQAFGCEIGIEMFTISNLLFATFSIAVLVKIKNSDNQRLKQKLLVIELLVWISKLMFYKGGYATGFGGVPNIVISSYDFAAIGLRTYLLLHLLDHKKMAVPLAIILALSCSILKTKIFPIPAYTTLKWHLDDNYAKNQRSKSIGNYAGKIYQFEDSKTLPAKITIDSLQILFHSKTFNYIAASYDFYVDYPNSGSLVTDNSGYEVGIEKMKNDSLIMILGESFDPLFKLSLKKIR